MLIPNVAWCEFGRCIPCPFCDSEEYQPHIHEEFAWVTVSIVRCCNCGHRYANPCPTPEAAAKHYNSQYLRQKGTALPVSLEAVADPNSIWASKMRHYEFIVSVLPKLAPDISVLDDGCSWGGLLATIRKYYPGAELTGVDLANDSIDFVTKTFGFKGEVGTLTDYVTANSTAKFDLILSSHCLEHSLAPRDSILAMVSALSPEGQLFITLPNHDSYLRKQMGGFAPAIRGGNHYQFFSQDFLCRALEEAGLIVECSFTSSEVSPYRSVIQERLAANNDPRAGLSDATEKVDAEGEGEFIYILAKGVRNDN